MDAHKPILSIVIPARNAEEKLEQCLKTIQSLNRDDIEVIVVDDASTDETPEVVEKYNYTLEKLSQQRGPAVARNKGVEVSKGEIILFIDSDILISDKTVPLILEDLSHDTETAAVVGMLDKEMPYKNISSQYFNLRKHYDYLLVNDDLKNLYASITAIRKRIFLEAGGFNETYVRASVEDAELGRRLYRLGYRIKLNKDIRVVHLKQHSLLALICSDFRRASSFIKFVIRERLVGNIAKEKRFASFRMGAIGTVSLVPLLLVSLITIPFFKWSYLALYTYLIIYILANYGFLKFTAGVLGWKKNILMPFMILVDSLGIFSGILFGSMNFLMGNKY